MSFKVTQPHIGPYFCAIQEGKYRFWCRVKNDGVGVIRYKHSESNRVHVHAFPLMARFDNTGVIDIELEPGQSYMVQMGIVKGASLEQLSVPDLDINWPADTEIYINTFPSSDSEQDLETAFVMGSCRHLGGWFSGSDDAAFTCMQSMMEANAIQPDFILMMGNQVYADSNGKRISAPPSDLQTYFKKYRRAFSRPNFARVLKKIPSYTIFNDHEIQKQWSIGKYENEEKGYNFEDFSNGILAYQSYQANLSPVIKDYKTVSEAPDNGLSVYGEKGYGEIPFWYQFSHGRSDFFVMDVRGERREPFCMISKEQLLKVQEFLLQNPKHKKFIVSSVPVFPDTKPPFGVPGDKWTAFPNQRKQLLQFIHEKQKTGEVKDVTFLSGGVHCSFVAQAQFPGVQYTMYSVVSSAFNWLVEGLQNRDFIWDHVRGFPINELSLERKSYGGGVVEVQSESNFAYLSVTDDSLKVTFYASSGEKLEEHNIEYNTNPVQEPEAYAVAGQFDGFSSRAVAGGGAEKKIVAFEKTPDPGRKFY